jgi:hypothetical protein
VVSEQQKTFEGGAKEMQDPDFFPDLVSLLVYI